MNQPAAILPDDVLALLTETAALAQAGVPLEAGLKAVARDLPPRMQRLAGEFSQRLERGESLEALLADKRLALPQPYAAVVTAGVRSGRLGDALRESVETDRRLGELRAVLQQSLWYPLAVALLAYGVWLMVVVYSMPILQRLYLDSRSNAHWLVRLYRPLLASWPVWGPAAPLIALAAVWFWQRRSARRWPRDAAEGRPIVRRLPRFRHVAALGQQAQFAQILALLVRYETPLDQAVRLAAQATGNATMAQAGGQIADRLVQGQSVDEAWPAEAPFSPSTRWLALAGGPSARLAVGLRDSAATLQRVAELQAQRARLVWPMVWTVLIGGTAALVASASLFLPITDLYQHLARP